MADVCGPFAPLRPVVRERVLHRRDDGIVVQRHGPGFCFHDVTRVPFLLPWNHVVHDHRATGGHRFLDGRAAGLADDEMVDAEQARHQLGLATTFLGDDAEEASIRAEIQDLLGYLTDDLAESRTHRLAAWQAATEAGHALGIAQFLVGVADLAARQDQYEQAARLLAASVGVRGLPDRSHPDAARIERTARRHLGEARFAEVTREGMQTNWSQLVEDTLAS